MPYSIIHLEIADRLIKNYNYENNYFYIGNLAPDAISLNKNATIEDKRQVHLYGARSIEERFNSINQMYVKYKNKISTDFLDGWTSHLLTDNLWLYLLNWNFKYEYESSMESVKKEEMYRRENKILESKLFNEKSMEYGDIIEKIHDIENIETPSNLTEKEINEWICTIKKQDYINTSTKNIYFTVNKAKIFMNITTEVIKYAFDFSIMEAHGYLIKKYEEGCLAKINET